MKLTILLRHFSFKNIVRAIRYLLKKGPLSFVKRLIQEFEKDKTYAQWFEMNRVAVSELEAQRRERFVYEPKISILVPTYKTPLPYLKKMIDSVCEQSYTNWELCIADGTIENRKLRIALEEYSSKDERIKVVFLKENMGISENTNVALGLATGDFIGLLDHDDFLEPNALYEVVKRLQDASVDITYSDEDKFSEDLGEYVDPNFKPDFSIDLLRSHNYITHFLVVRKTIVDAVGGFHKECDGAQDYDLVLRCSEKARKIEHIPMILYHWRMCKGSTADDPKSKMYCYEAGKLALEDHLKRCGLKGTVEYAGEGLWGLYHVKYAVIGNPLVSIIIANRDHIEDLDKCIRSIQEKSTYINLEFVIVENNSINDSTFVYYEKIQRVFNNIKVVYWDDEFNYSAINNYGVSKSKGEYLLLLNNDTEIISPTAIEEMLGICMREDVGAVGAKLLYEDETIQHAGVVIGFGGYAGHVFHAIGRYDYGFMMRPRINCNYSAVTAACLMTKRVLFDKVNGLSEEYKIACNDVDFCLKLRELDKLIVYAAFAEWFHYESKSRGYDEEDPQKKARYDGEVAIFRRRWKFVLDSGDPFYNKNFPVTIAPFTLDMSRRTD